MSNYLLKTGASSIILGKGHYGNYLPVKKGKLLKIFCDKDTNFEIQNSTKIRSIENYHKYFIIPDEFGHLLIKTDTFYHKVRELLIEKNLETDILNNILYCSYVDYGGDKDLHDILNEMSLNSNISYWKSYDRILKFIKHIMLGLKYLHQNKIAHLDIKPENIMINTNLNQYRIIDFGYSSEEPFDYFIKNVRGTPGYFPINCPDEETTEWLPQIKANDLKIVDGVIPFVKDYKLIYKIDSFCLGRVLYFLKYTYDLYRVYKYRNSEKSKGIKIDRLVSDLLNEDVFKRITISDCFIKYF